MNFHCIFYVRQESKLLGNLRHDSVSNKYHFLIITSFFLVPIAFISVFMATILFIVNKTEIYFILFRSNETYVITTSLVLDPER